MKIKGKLLFAGLSLLALLGFVFAPLNGIGEFLSINTNASVNQYSITLNSQNAVSTNGDHTLYSPTGGAVKFTYSGASSSSGNHVALASGGTIVNKDIIHSIEQFRAVFTGSLQARVAYVTNSWGEYFDLVSGQTLNLNSYPYYIEIKATANTVLESAYIQYTCLINDDAEEQDTSSSYDITFKAAGSDSSTALTNSNIANQVTSGSSYISSFSDVTKVYEGANGLKLGSSSAIGSFKVYFNNSNVSESITTVDFTVAKYGSDTGTLDIYVNGSNTKSVSITPSAGTGSVTVNANLTSLEIKTSTKRAYLIGMSLNYGSTVEPGVPSRDEIGFSATDANKNNYTTNSVFDNDNGLNVLAKFSDGTTESLVKGNSGYSYVVRDSLNNVVDTSINFASEGDYSVTISYKEYVPVIINFTVGEYVYILDITPSMNVVSFTTADRLSDHLTGNLSATVSFSNGSSTDIAYSSFASKGIGVYLFTPKGFTYEQNTPFGSAGNWKVQVYSLEDRNINGEIQITVNAIPVQTITLNESSYTLVVDGTLQLTTTINPNNVTNDSVYWSSNNEDVATVSETGLVTAIAVGGATITATAADGSGVMATCSITVNAKPAVSEYEINATVNTQITTSSTSSVVFSEDPVTVTISKSSSGTNANNYIPNTYSHTRVYTSQRFTISADGNPISEIVIHGNSAKGVGGFTGATWTNADMSYDGYEVTLIPNDPESDVYCSITATSSFTGVTVKVGGGEPESPIYPTAIALSSSKNSIAIGETTQLTTTYTPAETNVKNIAYSSSNNSVATVSAEGLITGVGEGNATITATAEAANSETVQSTFNVTVTPVAVTSISLNTNSTTVKAGKTVTLEPTILPANATNKNVIWSTSNNTIASVSNGVVTGVSVGNATITATTQDGNKTASCVVSVTAGGVSSSWELVTDDASLEAGDVLVLASSAHEVVNGDISSQIFTDVTSTFSQDKTEITELSENAVTLTLGGSVGEWTFANEEGELLGATAVKKLAWDSGTTTWSISIFNGNATIQNTQQSYGKFLYNSSSPRFTTYSSSPTATMVLPQLYRGGTAEPIDPTGLILNPTSIELAPGGSKTISTSFVPSNANQNKDITWTTSNSNVATVSNGTVSISNSATEGQSATITATLTNIPAISATCSISVVASTLDDHTVMIYMCGADLESGTDNNGNVPSASNAAGYASSDLDEILKVAGQPDDVNIIIETGGANIWQSGHSYSISNTKLERWHVENKSLVKDDSLTYASMGLTSTFQSFVEWGLRNYPAERTGIILWNHGGGMHGVCYDEKKSDDALQSNEIKNAVKSAFTSTGRSTNDKLEWIGYDACLMAVQDIAEFNSTYFNYQISSEESEAGYGWDYDNWVDNLYNKQSTTAILKEICDTFIKDNGGVSSNGDQTLSYLDLSYISAYKTAWENMAVQLKTKLTNNNKTTFNNAIINNVKHYADSDYDYFCLFDAKDFINKLASASAFSSFRIDSSYTTAVLNAHSNLVAYSTAQKGAGNSYGICMYWTNNSTYSYISGIYTSTYTNFSEWQSLCSTYGTYRQ